VLPGLNNPALHPSRGAESSSFLVVPIFMLCGAGDADMDGSSKVAWWHQVQTLVKFVNLPSPHPGSFLKAPMPLPLGEGGRRTGDGSVADRAALLDGLRLFATAGCWFFPCCTELPTTTANCVVIMAVPENFGNEDPHGHPGLNAFRLVILFPGRSRLYILCIDPYLLSRARRSASFSIYW